MRVELAVKMALVAAPLLLSGCATFGQVHQAVHQTSTSVSRDLSAQKRLQGHPVVTVTSTPYLMGSVVRVDRDQPPILKQTVHLTTGQPMTLSQLATQVTQMTGLPIHISSQVEGYMDGQQTGGGATSLPALPGGRGHFAPPMMPNMGSGKNSLTVNDWNGSLGGLLTLMASHSGTFWKYEHGQVRFFLTETRVFNVSVLPGNTAMAASISNAGTSGGSSGGGGGGGASGGNNGSTSQTATLNSSMNIYKSIGANVKAVLAQSKSALGGGAGGMSMLQVPTSVSTNPSSGQVIVTATPPELRAVAGYVRQLNALMTKNVLIDVHVYAVSLNKSNNYSLSLNTAFNSLGQGLSPLTMKSPTTSGQPSGAGEISGGIVTSAITANVVAQALATQGKVSLVTSGSVIALNGQPTPLQVSNQVSYLQSVSSTQTANVGSSSSLTPGQFTTGFSGSFLPLVRGHNVLLEYSINLTQNLGLSSYSSGGSSIQLPNLATQAFMQRVNLHSGQTLVLSGFEQTSNQNNHTGVGAAKFWGMGGGASASRSRTELVVVIHVVNLGS
ncbi:PilN family type IVB pilus formation outer membrane protein [Acidithiobacillus sp. MC6.1]|nr:PilN family type IVB pilus formation outer membrane protein [Acidithiobacillus sp. MC6.1]